MTETVPAKIETVECGTNEDGSGVILVLSGDGFENRYLLPTQALGIFIEQLLKMHNTARAHAVLTEVAKENVSRKVQPVLETFLVDDLTIVAADGGPVTLRIVSSDGARDIVFPPSQWEFLRSPLLSMPAASSIPAVH